ncbi:hypothetical protein Ccrd_001421, partial [Cynara cardunculus var. scolymus]
MTIHSSRKRFRRLTVFINDEARFTLLSRDSQIPHDSADFVEATTFGGSNIDPTAWEEKKCK